MRYSMWAELPSPLKTEFRDAFQRWAANVYHYDKTVLTSYIPPQLGGSMKAEDYLIYMEEDRLPDCYVTMSYGECSDPRFQSRLLDTGVYGEPVTWGYFPEFMVVDLVRLGNRPLPAAYEDLCSPDYRGEVCLIGSPKIPDPMAALYIYRKCGEEAMLRFIKNIAGFAAPVDTIRHIGKPSNRFGSVFIMPSLFAAVCTEKSHAAVIIPKTGAVAEPLILMNHRDSRHKTHIEEFLMSAEVKKLLEEKNFASAGSSIVKIDDLCRKPIYTELEMVYSFIKKNLNN